MNGTGRDERQREMGGNLPGLVGSKPVVLGNGEKLVDDEPGGGGWVGVAIKSIDGVSRGGNSHFTCGPATRAYHSVNRIIRCKEQDIGDMDRALEWVGH